MHASRRTGPLLLAFAAATTLAACGSDRGAGGGRFGGTVVIATPAPPRSLFPTYYSQSTEKQVADLVFDHLAEIGDSLNTFGDAGFRPRLAKSWSWASDSLSIAFHLDSMARWHDGKPLRSDDVRFTWQVAVDPAVQSELTSLVTRIDSVTAPNPLTAVFWFHRRYPQQFFDAVYHMHVLPKHLLDSVPRKEFRSTPFNRTPVGSGRFRFAKWDEGSRVELVADTTNWRGRPNLDRIVIAFTPDLNAMFTRVFAGEADIAEPVLNPALLAEAPKHPNVALTRLAGSDYGFLQLNFHDARDATKPNRLFGDRGVRQALAHAIDRATLVKSVFDTLALPAVGPMTRWQQLADTTVPFAAYDPARATAMLDSLGWRDAKGTGVREKNGVPLRFSLLVPNSSRVRQQFAVLLQDALKKVGMQVDVEQLDFGAYMDRVTRGNFDATLNAWHTDPSLGSLTQTWGSGGSRLKGGQNFGDYESRMFDQALDSALSQRDPEKARPYFRRAFETINQDLPAVWLYEPKWNAFIHRRIRTTGMRPDAWWAGMADWSIPAGERIARDRATLGGAAKP